jgi:hypothetical protein
MQTYRFKCRVEKKVTDHDIIPEFNELLGVDGVTCLQCMSCGVMGVVRLEDAKKSDCE